MVGLIETVKLRVCHNAPSVDIVVFLGEDCIDGYNGSNRNKCVAMNDIVLSNICMHLGCITQCS